MKNRIEKVVKQIKAQINIEPELGIVVSYGLSEITFKKFINSFIV